MLESGHAYRVSHLHHHAHYPDSDDPEGQPAHGSYLGALLAGPTFLFRLFVFAWKRQRHMRGWLVLEGGWFISALLIAIANWRAHPTIGIYVLAMIIASWSYPFMTVRLVHDPAGDGPLHQTRTARGTLTPKLFLELGYHLEHHLYPMVPSHHYRELANSLQPYLDANNVLPIRVP